MWKWWQCVQRCVCVWVGGGGRLQGCSWLCHPQQLFPSNPVSPPSSTPSPHNETNIKEQEVPPGNWGPIKAVIIPMSEFLEEMASQKICQLCRECVIIVLQVVSVFAFLFSAAANKRTQRPVSTTCTAHCHCWAFTRQARHFVLSGAGWLLCTLWKGLPCSACTGFFGSHPELSNCLFKPCAQRASRCNSMYVITHTRLCLLKTHLWECCSDYSINGGFRWSLTFARCCGKVTRRLA